jgi:aryl-alcohol dehydrogenase-like predicted oxidoreductase
MDRRSLGRYGPLVSPIGFGAVKIGRTLGLKYPAFHALPSESEATQLLNGVLDLGINLIDTAPAYGSSEERIGRAIGHRREEYVLSTKAGEAFADGQSTFDFSGVAIRRSLEASLRRLRTDRVDLLLLHSDGRAGERPDATEAVEALLALRSAGMARLVGLSAKTTDGARAALGWADVLMVEYHQGNETNAGVIAAAHAAGIGVLVKKGLGSGHLAATEALRFAMAPAGVSSVVVGSLNLEHLAENLAAVQREK